MSSIEERIQKHEILATKSYNTIQRCKIIIERHSKKLTFHENAAHRLKAKQEKKVD